MRISLILNPVRGGWTPLDPETWRGGEETVVYWTRAMAARGHDVTVLWDGAALDDRPSDHVIDRCVLYRPMGTSVPMADVAIHRKVPTATEYVGARTILWGEGGLDVPDPDLFDQIVVPTAFCARGYQARIPALPTTVIPLGYDAGVAVCPDGVTRDANLVLTASSPERGLVELLECWPTVLDARPDARLEIAYGWETYDKFGGPPGVKAAAQIMLDKFPNVHMAQRTQDELARLYWQAGVWAYYCTGGEDYCLTAIKAQVAGAYPVVKPWGALHETVVPPALFPTNQTQFTEALIAALDERTQQAWADTRPLDHCYTWDDVAVMWEDAIGLTPPTRPSELVQVPGLPAGLLPDADGEAAKVIRDRVGRWIGETGARLPWADPNSGLFCAPLPPDTPPDAIILGWGLEDAAQSPRATLEEFAVPPGVPVLLMTSLGPWRARQRYRVMDQQSLLDVFGTLPDFRTEVTGVADDGSAVVFSMFTYDPAKIGDRDIDDATGRVYPRETLSVCFIAPYRTNSPHITAALQSVECIADDVVVVLNGETSTGRYEMRELVEDWQAHVATQRGASIPTKIVDGTSPRWCFDCLTEHAVGEIMPGHRLAGFETPRNQSVAAATGQWVLWLDSDEELMHGERLGRMLRQNIFRGYALNQDHYASEPPEAFKRDTPMRLFRRVETDTPAGWDDAAWPSYRTGCTMQFAGVVHEHPGEGEDVTTGADPVMLIPDVWIGHRGYGTEAARRGRFQRNWPLMMADHIKYPHRRLGTFLWLRDLVQQMRYETNLHGGTVTPLARNLADEAMRVYNTEFKGSVDPFTAEADRYAADAARALQIGFDVDISVVGRCPELTGPEEVRVEFSGRVQAADEIPTLLASRVAGMDRWSGAYR